jgi:zinc protease
MKGIRMSRALRGGLSGLLLSVSLALSPPVSANPYETTLDNGLKVIVKEDRKAPTAAQMVWYKAGSMDEVDGTSGIAHLLEHMMFKGTPAVGPGEFSKRVAAAGGRDNAFTSWDYTAYFQQVPRESLEEMMKIEADRMRHLTLDPKEFAQEAKVVMEERRMRTDDEPTALLYEQLAATAFVAHPYRRPIIGWMNDLENLAPEDARAWYDAWYLPNNATLVVVGDVDHQQVFKLARQYYGPAQARPLPGRKPREEPAQTGIRRVTVKAPAELPEVIMAYKAPALRNAATDREPYALQMLAAVLSGHDAARFTRRLVKEQGVAVSASASYDLTSRGPGLFLLSGTPRPGRSVAEVEDALRAEIADVVLKGVSAAELKRAKAQLVAGEIYKRDSTFAQAMEIGMYETLGYGYKAAEQIIEGLKAVSAEEVRDAAVRLFRDDALTVGTLVPQALPDAPRRPTAAVRH